MSVAMCEKHPQECCNCIGQAHLETYSSFRSMSYSTWYRPSLSSGQVIIEQRLPTGVPKTTATGSAKKKIV